jgi:hypothetical protein
MATQDCIENILKDKSPMLALYRSSKELFHTNFISWLLELDNGIGLQVCNLLLNTKWNGSIFVEREKNNVDITITYKGKKYLLENKVKDVLTEEQDYKIKNKGLY